MLRRETGFSFLKNTITITGTTYGMQRKWGVVIRDIVSTALAAPSQGSPCGRLFSESAVPLRRDRPPSAAGRRMIALLRQGGARLDPHPPDERRAAPGLAAIAAARGHRRFCRCARAA